MNTLVNREIPFQEFNLNKQPLKNQSDFENFAVIENLQKTDSDASKIRITEKFIKAVPPKQAEKL